MIATLGDGISTSTGTSLTVNQGIRTLQIVWREKQRTMGGDIPDLQDGHSEAKPEVLLIEYLDSVGIPLVFVNIIAVPQHDKYPG